MGSNGLACDKMVSGPCVVPGGTTRGWRKATGMVAGVVFAEDEQQVGLIPGTSAVPMHWCTGGCGTLEETCCLWWDSEQFGCAVVWPVLCYPAGVRDLGSSGTATYEVPGLSYQQRGSLHIPTDSLRPGEHGGSGKGHQPGSIDTARPSS